MTFHRWATRLRMLPRPLIVKERQSAHHLRVNGGSRADEKGRSRFGDQEGYAISYYAEHPALRSMGTDPGG